MQNLMPVRLSAFQSTLPRGERRDGLRYILQADEISIHAPARGATQGSCVRVRNYKFQSTLPRGERLLYPPKVSVPPYFNPRSREGSDRIRWPYLLTHQNFNPRSREGSDIGGFVIQPGEVIFQSTLPRGERPPW